MMMNFAKDRRLNMIEDKVHRCSRLDQFKDKFKRSQVLIKGEYEGIIHTCDI